MIVISEYVSVCLVFCIQFQKKKLTVVASDEKGSRMTYLFCNRENVGESCWNR